ncbi:MAG: type VI secretion system baseplate subunit TssK [Desulfobacteraceae bacterium]|jgi:type VI secretion system protein ImpJ
MNASNQEANEVSVPGKPIFWHEGLFLQPHHFQWQDLYLQSMIEPLNRYLVPSLWGTGKLVVHTEALSNFVFNVINGEFRFRDMTHAVFPGNAVLESRNFEKAWKDKGKPFNVYLGIRKLSPNGKNVSDPLNYESYSMVPTRYTADSETENLPDFYEGTEPLAIERLRYVLKLLWEEEKSAVGDYEVLHIARLENQNGHIVLSPVFIPPALSIFSSNVLVGCVKSISELITATSNRLEASKKERGVHTAEFGTKDMVFLLTLRTLNRFSPVLRHMLGSGHCVHPWSVYGVFCQLIGELSTFSSKINLVRIRKDDPYYLPGYDHEELSRCFLRAIKIMTKLMGDIAADPEYIAQFKYDGSEYKLKLPPKMLKGRKRYYLVIETTADRKKVVTELESMAKLSSPEYLGLLIAQSLPGIEVSHVKHPPPELPSRSMGIYFIINHQSRLWQKVLEEKSLALSWDTRPEDAKIELMVSGRDE